MKIDILSETTLKLTLTAEDMNRHQLRYEAFSEEGSGCRKTLGKLLKGYEAPESAAMAQQLLSDERRLFIEAFKRMDGGCMLYVSSLDRSRRRKCANTAKRLLEDNASPLIFETASGENLGALCRCLVWEQRHGAKFKSKLFTDNCCYRLAITPLNICTGHIMRLFCEFGKATDSELDAAFTNEHFKVLTEENAVQTAADIF